jgi:hypothetical protein
MAWRSARLPGDEEEASFVEVREKADFVASGSVEREIRSDMLRAEVALPPRITFAEGALPSSHWMAICQVGGRESQRWFDLTYLGQVEGSKPAHGG